jgi:hypothetical protein
MHLDIRTLVVVAVSVALVTSVIGALVWNTRHTYPGFGRWTLGNFLATLALVLLSLRGIAPDWTSIVLSNMLAAAAAILFFQGIRMFCGMRPHWWPEYVMGVLAICAVTYFRYSTNNINVRILVMSVWLGIFGLACGFTLIKTAPTGRRFSMILTGIVFALAAGANLVRGIYVYTHGSLTDMFGPSTANALFFGAASLGVVSWSFGFILMTAERLVMDSKGTLVAVATVDGTDIDKAVPETEVRQQVQRILASDIFRRSARMERFLTLAVDRALTGHPEALKEYALGRDVFNRGEDYDPRVDSIVRVEAQRLRRKLREYYNSSGKNDRVIVDFHAGSYVPSFRYRSHNEPQRTFVRSTFAGS